MVIESWEQAAVIGGVVLVLLLVVVVLRRKIKKVRVRPWGVSVETADDPDTDDQEVHVRRSRIVRSLIDVVKKTSTTVVDSKVKKSTIRVRGKDEPPPSAPGNADRP
jgi:hypothetical protein